LNNMRVYIYGVPGVGKTYISRLVGKKLGYPVFEADNIKKKARKGKSKIGNPFLYLSTCFAFRHFGKQTNNNVIKGLVGVREAYKGFVAEETKDKNNVVIEGAFLDPASLEKKALKILLVCRNERKHKSQFLKHREKLLDIKGVEFRSARIIQDFLIEESKKLSIKIVESNEDSIGEIISALQKNDEVGR
jgi:2-phosphoglycerate kinase